MRVQQKRMPSRTMQASSSGAAGYAAPAMMEVRAYTLAVLVLLPKESCTCLLYQQHELSWHHHDGQTKVVTIYGAKNPLLMPQHDTALVLLTSSLHIECLISTLLLQGASSFVMGHVRGHSTWA